MLLFPPGAAAVVSGLGIAVGVLVEPAERVVAVLLLLLLLLRWGPDGVLELLLEPVEGTVGGGVHGGEVFLLPRSGATLVMVLAVPLLLLLLCP